MGFSFSFGKGFRISIFGESHGNVVGALVEGCPAGLRLAESDVQRELDRRRPGQALTSPRREPDEVRILSGVFNGRANGGPISLVVKNEDVDSSWYEANRHIPRPGHADYAAYVKYGGFNDYRGGGFFSGRMTAGMVMAGAVAKTLLSQRGVQVMAHVVQIGRVAIDGPITDEQIARSRDSPVRCADPEASKMMIEELERAAADRDSLGGAVECRVTNLPVGVGEPIFDSVESVVAHGIFSIPAVKAIEFGSGSRLCSMRGSEANDEFTVSGGRVSTKTNNCGGVIGGLTDGMPLVFRACIKPTPSIGKPQRSVNLKKMEETELSIAGRHDPCIAVRAVPVVEAMTAICIADLMIRSQDIPRTVSG